MKVIKSTKTQVCSTVTAAIAYHEKGEYQIVCFLDDTTYFGYSGKLQEVFNLFKKAKAQAIAIKF